MLKTYLKKAFFIIAVVAAVLSAGVTVYAGTYNGFEYRDVYDPQTGSFLISISGYNGTDTEVIIPDTINESAVIAIEGSAFKGNSTLTSIKIPESVTVIANYAFKDCSSLKSITIPKNVTSIATDAFEGCIGLESIIVENGNTVYDSRNGCNAIIKKNIDEPILMLGCKNTTIPNTVQKIERTAFRGCSGLKSLAIPESVKEIENGAFYGCTGLSSITVDPESPVYDSGNGCNAIIKKDGNILILVVKTQRSRIQYKA